MPQGWALARVASDAGKTVRRDTVVVQGVERLRLDLYCAARPRCAAIVRVNAPTLD
jgi:hypothetical protein